jgi:hypothetical protein
VPGTSAQALNIYFDFSPTPDKTHLAVGDPLDICFIAVWGQRPCVVPAGIAATNTTDAATAVVMRT